MSPQIASSLGQLKNRIEAAELGTWYGDGIRRAAYECLGDIANVFEGDETAQMQVYDAGELTIEFIRTREQEIMIGPVSQPHLRSAKSGFVALLNMVQSRGG